MENNILNLRHLLTVKFQDASVANVVIIILFLFFLKGTYIAEDARPVLGVYALPVGLSAEKIDKCYEPAVHIFYGSRILDVTDNIPKWDTMPKDGAPDGKWSNYI